jgi:hypothetical protein
MPDTSGYWYSLVAASPNPETEEAANVAIVAGNGVAYRIVFDPNMPRLCGLADAQDVAVYRTILKAVEDQVRRGINPVDLQAQLGAQLQLRTPRALFKEPTDEVLARLSKNFLERPKAMGDEAAASELVRKSTGFLAAALVKAAPRGADISERVTPKKLYGHKLGSHLPYRVPAIATAVRLGHVDVLVDSLIVENDVSLRAITVATGRVSLAFFAYNQLRQAIHEYTARDVALIGVIHPSKNGDPTTNQRREWVKHSWQSDAEVIDGNEVDVQAALRERLDRLRA